MPIPRVWKLRALHAHTSYIPPLITYTLSLSVGRLSAAFLEGDECGPWMCGGDFCSGLDGAWGVSSGGLEKVRQR